MTERTIPIFHPSPFSDGKLNFYPLHIIGFHIKQTTPYLCPKPHNSIELLILHEVGLLLISDKQKLNRYENIRQTGVRDSASLVSPANIQNRNTDEAYMPVYIEIIDRSETYKHISLAHYGEQNGDMMRDPEMLFALHKETRQFIPYYYRNDYMGVEQYSVKWTDEGILLNRRLQADHTTFANQWLRNIAAQQGIR